MNFEAEKMKAGYAFVRILRVLGYACLIGSMGAAITLACLNIRNAVLARSAHDNLRASLNQSIVQLSEEIEPAVLRAREQERQAVAAKASEHAAARAQYDRALIIALSEVGKLSTIPVSLREKMKLDDAVPESIAAVEKRLADISTCAASLDELKKLIYKDINEGYKTLLGPLGEKYEELQAEYTQHERKIQEYKAEIWRIKNSEKDASVYSYVTGKHVEPTPNVYGASTDNDVTPFQQIAMTQLPAGSVKIPYIPEETDTCQTLKENITNLQKWLPYMTDGEMKTWKEEAIKLTAAQRARMTELSMYIGDEEVELERLGKELQPIKARLEQILLSRKMVVEDTIATTTSGWTIESVLAAMGQSANDLLAAMRAQNNKVLQTAVRLEYEGKIEKAKAAIKDSIISDLEESNACLLRKLPIIGMLAGAAWVACFLLQVLADFLACPLVLALRTQFDEELRKR